MSCARAMVYTASATSKQQGKVRRVYGSYTQAVDKPVDKFVRVDFVVDKFWDGVGKTQNVRAHFTPKNSNNYKALYHAKVCILCNFSIVQVSNF